MKLPSTFFSFVGPVTVPAKKAACFSNNPYGGCSDPPYNFFFFLLVMVLNNWIGRFLFRSFEPLNFGFLPASGG
jgi:hypothetical protein